jgi:ceramide glucosyltransferase
MVNKVILGLWSCAGLSWWLLAWSLVAAQARRSAPAARATARRTLSVFKPLPSLGETGLRQVAAGLKSFAAQLDPQSELLLGIHEADRNFTAPFLKQLRAEFPHARLNVVFRSEPDTVANPKIAWQKILARHATGGLWLWSDADIIAPPGFLQSARAEFAQGGAGMMTFPYVVRKIPSPPALLETLFVNAEFYPGVLLLRGLGPVDFGLGAAMLFHRDDFLREIDWSEIGARLADDFFLGQRLGPVRIGATTLETAPAPGTWKDAVRHDLRWAKTIRWSRPAGSFARILIMPVAGWLAAIALHPFHLFPWLGLVAMIQAEVFLAASVCRSAGCRLGFRQVMAMEIWSFWRILLWLLCRLPGPISWSGKVWREPRAPRQREMSLKECEGSR